MISDNATHTERFVGCRPRRLCYWRGHQEQLVIAPLSARGQSSTTEASSSTTYYRPRSGLAAELLAVARRRSSRPRAWKRSETYIHTSTTTVTSNGLSSSLRLRLRPSRRRKKCQSRQDENISGKNCFQRRLNPDMTKNNGINAIKFTVAENHLKVSLLYNYASAARYF